MKTKWKLFFAAWTVAIAANAYLLHPTGEKLFPSGFELQASAAETPAKGSAKSAGPGKAAKPAKAQPASKAVATAKAAPSDADFSLKTKVAATLRKDHADDAEAVASLKAGTLLRPTGSFSAPADSGTLTQDIAVTAQGKPYNLSAGTEVRIPVYSKDKCSISFDVGDEEVIWQVDTDKLKIKAKTWKRAATQDGTEGWLPGEDLSDR
jgi:hypothetical protein